MLTRILVFATVSVAIYFAIALALIASQSPNPAGGSGESVDFSDAIEADYSGLPERRQVEMADGTPLYHRDYPASGEPGRTLVLIHGSAWHGMQFHPMASRIASTGAANVVVPDMRGHGESPQRRGDVDYIGQMEDDIAGLIAHLREERGAGHEIILGGHSSGGGFVIRFAGGRHGAMADRFVLLAPFLRHDAPTTRENAGGWARPAIRRIIGLSMLNQVGITALNHLPVIGFDMPRSVLDGPFGHTATTAYSYRLNTGFAPRSDYEADLRAMTRPFLLLAGSEDEAFIAEAYEPVISAQTDSGEYEVLSGLTHSAIVTSELSADYIAEWLVGEMGR